MALMWRVVARWAGGAIGTGFTNFYFTEGIGTAQAAVDACRQFLNTAFGTSGADLPTGVTITFPATVDVVEPGTGVLVTTLSVSAPGTIVGAGTGTYAAPSGGVISWVTGGVVNGHRVKGRTFCVPLNGSAYQNDGTLAAQTLSQFNSAASAFIAATPEFVVWHRPASITAGGGSTHPVLAFKINDRVAVLTSRR